MGTSQIPPHVAPKFQRESQVDYAGTAELWANESYLRKYNSDLVAMLSNTYKPGQRVLEFGAGIGTLALLWRSLFKVDPLCVEIDSDLQAVLRLRGFDVYGSLDSIPSEVDLVYTSNVLEHIEDDVAALKQLRSKLLPTGIIAIYVPAMMVLYSNMDTNLGHYRRYGRTELIEKLTSAGFEVERCEYADSLGFLAWGLMKLRGNRSGSEADGDRLLSVYDQYIYPVSRLLDKSGMRRVLGKNIFALARCGS